MNQGEVPEEGEGEEDKAEATPKRLAKPRSELDNALAQTMKIREQYLKVCAKARSLLDLVDEGGNWSWAANEQNAGVLKNNLEALQGLMKSSELGSFITEDTKELRKQVGVERLLVLARRFLAADDTIKQVASAHAELLRMHKARSGK